jgi:hypothetical protein
MFVPSGTLALGSGRVGVSLLAVSSADHPQSHEHQSGEGIGHSDMAALQCECCISSVVDGHEEGDVCTGYASAHGRAG